MGNVSFCEQLERTAASSSFLVFLYRGEYEVTFTTSHLHRSEDVLTSSAVRQDGNAGGRCTSTALSDDIISWRNLLLPVIRKTIRNGNGHEFTFSLCSFSQNSLINIKTSGWKPDECLCRSLNDALEDPWWPRTK